jgi:predicted polyphosphate/ATP-dependent NAD kinase
VRKIGLVVNPAAGKDIRRLVAWGSVFGNREKINILVRILKGFLGVTQGEFSFVYMPDPYDLVGVMCREVAFPKRIFFERAPTPSFGDALDTLLFTEWATEEAKVEALLVLGGDGTNRVVAKKSGDVPLFSISSGTNNVFANTFEPTLAGMALGFFLEGRVSQREVVERRKLLRCFSEEREDVALIDVVVVRKEILGTKALWEPECVEFVAVTQSHPLTIGLSAIVGRMVSIAPTERRGAFVRLGPRGKPLSFPLAPGLVERVGVEEFGIFSVGEEIPLPQGAGAIALDGEREILTHSGECWWVRLEEKGPMKANIAKILELAQERSA